MRPIQLSHRPTTPEGRPISPTLINLMVLGGLAVVALFFRMAAITGRRDQAANDARWAELTGADEPAQASAARSGLSVEPTGWARQLSQIASSRLAAALPRAFGPNRLPTPESSLSNRSWPGR